MGGQSVGTLSRVFSILRSNAAPTGASATKKYVNRIPLTGWGTLRVCIFTDQLVTLNILQKPADDPDLAFDSDGGTNTFAMQQTDTKVVPASGNSQNYDFLVRGDYGEIDVVTGVAPLPTQGVFYIEATLIP